MGFRTVLLASPDEDLRLCRQGDANMGAGSARKGGACWRGPTEDKGFSGRATPTWAPVIIPPVANEGREDGVSVTCERTKERAKSPHMNCDCSALYLLNCPAGPTYRICLPSLPRQS